MNSTHPRRRLTRVTTLIAALVAGCVVAAPAAWALDVGYYEVCQSSGSPAQAPPITAAGHTAIDLEDLSAADLAGIDVLFLNNCDNLTYTPLDTEFTSRLADIEAAVAAGLVLVFHDRYVDPAETVLPGGASFDIQRHPVFPDPNNEARDINVLDPTTPLTNGPGGAITDTTLDGGSFSNHGFAIAGSLPSDARLILSTNDPTHIVTFAYGFGRGVVIYSSIPLDHYLGGSSAFATVYGVNAIGYAGQLAEANCGNGNVDAGEACDLGAGNNGESCCAFDCSIRDAGFTCRDGDACDTPEVCNGSSSACPADVIASAGTVCRPAADDCDVVEACNGVATTCPVDAVYPDGDGDTWCDLVDNCAVAPNADQADQDGDGFGDVCDLDHFACYKAKGTAGAPKFVPIVGVSLTDESGTSSNALLKQAALCNPANKNGEDPTAPSHPGHLEAYQIRPLPGGTKFVKRTNVRVVNQFGSVFVDAVKPDRLLVPTAKSLAGPVPPLAAPIVDHFECYKAKVSKGQPKFVPISNVSIGDQFGSLLATVAKPTRLCNPVNKNGEDPTAPSHPDHLMCYQVKAAKGAPKFTAVTPIYVSNQFGSEILDAVRPDEICVPSNANPACGNGVLETIAGEECDDGNTTSGDGCSATCRFQTLVPGNSPVFEDLTTCNPRVADRWVFAVEAGETVSVAADTVDAATAADLCIQGTCGSQSFNPDDIVACTFPPPAFACPATTFVAFESGACTLNVTLCSNACTTAATANYRLSLTRDGIPGTLTQTDDDLP